MSVAEPADSTRPIVILGANGQIGYELMRALAPLAPLRGFVRADQDFFDLAQLQKKIAALNPVGIINAAAYTAVDKAESEPELAMSLNAKLPAMLATTATDIDAFFVHYSSDYVFNGRAQVPYKETDPADPQGVYGRTKLAGDEAILKLDSAAIILRTSWVYGIRGNNFFLTMQKLARDNNALRVVADQIGCPTPARFIAAATAVLIAQSNISHDGVNPHRGLYNLASYGAVSWCEFAREIFLNSEDFAHVEVEAITTAEYPTPAARPAYSVLDTTLAQATFGIHAADWQALMLQELSAQA